MTTDDEVVALARAQSLAELRDSVTSAIGAVNASVTVLHELVRRARAIPRSSPDVVRHEAAIVAAAETTIRARHDLLRALALAGLRVEDAHANLHGTAVSDARQRGLPFAEGDAGDLPVDRWPIPAWLFLRALAADAAANAAITSVLFAWAAPR